MGLASAMTTALTGLSAAETKLDVSGNNLANAQTVGFKASDTVFANQFLRTLSLGSAPTSTSGGTNPRQVGLGVQVAEITPDFSPGTIEISASPSDLAIQGNGFFIVQGQQGQQLYTRNGIFKTNSQNELVTVTGERVLGFGVDESFNIQPGQLVPLTIPLGAATVTRATENVYLQGNLNAAGDIATAAEVIDSAVLGDGAVDRPDSSATRSVDSGRPDTAGSSTSTSAGSSGFLAGDEYEYTFAFVDSNGQESLASISPLGVTIGANNQQVTLSSLPGSPLVGGTPEYSQLNVYRRKVGVAASDPEFDFKQVGTAAQGAASFVDNGLAAGTLLDTTSLTGAYSYRITFSGPGIDESRPSDPLGPVSITNGRIHLDDLPSIPPGSGYTTVNIYRNLAQDPNTFFLVDTIAPGTDYTDSRSDAAISDLNVSGNRVLNSNGPPINTGTLLTDVIQQNGNSYENLFELGTLEFTGSKGQSEGQVASLASKTFEITATSTVGELLQFISAAMGIQATNPADTNPIPGSENLIDGGGGSLAPGATITADGRIRVVGNNGVANTIAINSDAFRMTDSAGNLSIPDLGFESVQSAVGEGTSSNVEVYDSLGVPLDVRLTTVLESRDGSLTTFRWFADSSGNDEPGTDTAIAVGTGLLTFDGDGNLVSSTNSQVNIQRADIPSATPLTINLDFSTVSSLATDTELSASGQDGSPPGTLTSFSVGEDGVIRGNFTGGILRDLGQIRLARFANPGGLEQVGRNMFTQSVNSGLPVTGNPGDLGIGSIVAGATELSNVDVGKDLIDLILASTMYRSNSRVISTAQQMLDELLNLRR